jgi:IstB-like ATP binding protein
VPPFSRRVQSGGGPARVVFPNAACAVALIDRLTHHAEIITIEGESYRKREAEQAQKRKQEQKPKR